MRIQAVGSGYLSYYFIVSIVVFLQEISKEGQEKVRATLKDMYDRGRSLQWKIPADEGEGTQAPAETLIESELQEIM